MVICSFGDKPHTIKKHYTKIAGVVACHPCIQQKVVELLALIKSGKDVAAGEIESLTIALNEATRFKYYSGANSWRNAYPRPGCAYPGCDEGPVHHENNFLCPTHYRPT